MELHNVASLNQTFNMTRLFRQVALVAVLTPVYNGARFLRETMECVQASDYTNMVHVILDNASTDATPEI